MLRQLSLDLKFHTNYDLDVFYKAPCNSIAYDWVNIWPNEDSCVQFSCIYGQEGSGKTHLLHIWKKRVNAYRITESDLKNYTPLDLVKGNRFFIYNHIDQQQNQEWFFHFYNALKEYKGYFLVSAYTPPHNWCTSLKDLKSRWLTFHSIELKHPDDETCGIILKKLLKDRGLQLSNRTISYVLKRIERSFKALYCWVALFDRYQTEHGALHFSDVVELINSQ